MKPNNYIVRHNKTPTIIPLDDEGGVYFSNVFQPS